MVGHGTTFTLYLPRVAAPEVAAEVDVGEPEPLMDGHGTCVLVVEDNIDVGTFATQTLAELGYTTVWTASGEEPWRSWRGTPIGSTWCSRMW